MFGTDLKANSRHFVSVYSLLLYHSYFENLDFRPFPPKKCVPLNIWAQFGNSKTTTLLVSSNSCDGFAGGRGDGCE